MNVLGSRIKKERENLNLTREDLAKKLGVSYSAIAMYEQGNREPNNEIILKMCEIFNCTIDYLMGKSIYRTSQEELKNYLKKEIEEDLIKNLKALELDENELEQAITAFLDNYIYISDEPTSIQIYDMEDSVVYYAYELLVKYYFKLIDKETSILLNEPKKLSNKQDIFEKAEELAWIKMKNLINDLDKNKVISNLTSLERAKKHISKITQDNKIFMCPVYGRIAAGQPNWAEECMEGYLPIDPNLMNIVNPEECFFLRVNGESMNKVIKNGAFALIRKTNWVEDGEIAVVLVNGYDATLKKFKRLKKSGFIMLEPQSNSDEFEPIIIDPKETEIRIIGKYIGKMEMN